MRRIVILVVLYALMQGVLVLSPQNAGIPALMMLGFLILAAYSVGELATPFRIPKIVGYMAAGLIFGPSGLNYVNSTVLNALTPVSNLAIAMIALLAGAELQVSEIRQRGAGIIKMMSAELVAGFLGIFVVIVALRSQLPILGTAPWPEVFAFALLASSVMVVHSPAATIALLSETNAKGPIARYTLGVVLLMDVAVVLLFSGTLAITRALVPPTGAVMHTSAVVWEIGGALLVGALLGVVVALYLRFIRRELLVFAILIALIGAEIARATHVEVLLTLLTAGFIAENVSQGRGEVFRHALERAAAPIFVVFFALSGARINPAAVLPLWTLVVPIVLVRLLGIWGGTRVGAKWAGLEPVVATNAWYGLVSQAGVAIGLATVVATVYPQRGEVLRSLLLAVIAVNQTLGPILFRHGLAKGGEIEQSNVKMNDAHVTQLETAH